MKRIRWTGTNAGKTTNAALLKDHHRPFRMGTAWRIDLKGKKGLERAMQNTEVTPGAIVFNDGHHGLTHEDWSPATAIILCLKNSWQIHSRAVKFIGSPPQPRYRGENNDR